MYIHKNKRKVLTEEMNNELLSENIIEKSIISMLVGQMLSYRSENLQINIVDLRDQQPSEELKKLEVYSHVSREIITTITELEKLLDRALGCTIPSRKKAIRDASVTTRDEYEKKYKNTENKMNIIEIVIFGFSKVAKYHHSIRDNILKVIDEGKELGIKVVLV